MRRLQAAFIAVVVAASSVSAQAATWTAIVGNSTYDFTTVSGTVADLSDTLQSQPWWGDTDFAARAASALGERLGTFDLAADFGVHAGPIVLSYVDTAGAAYGAFDYPTIGGTYSFAGVGALNSYTFVTAVLVSAAPEIDGERAPLAVLLIALLGMARLRRRADAQENLHAQRSGS